MTCDLNTVKDKLRSDYAAPRDYWVVHPQVYAGYQMLALAEKYRDDESLKQAFSAGFRARRNVKVGDKRAWKAFCDYCIARASAELNYKEESVA